MQQLILLQRLFVVAFKDHNMVSCLFGNANKLIIRVKFITNLKILLLYGTVKSLIKFEPISICSIDALADEINKNIGICSYTFIKIALIEFVSDCTYFDKHDVREKSINSYGKIKEIYKEIFRMMEEGEIPERFVAV